MKRLFALLAGFMLLAFTLPAIGAETVASVVSFEGQRDRNGSVVSDGLTAYVTFTYTTHVSDGTADGGATTVGFNGWVVGVKAIPSTSAAPTNAYDVTVVDANGVDLLQGNGADFSSTITASGNIRSVTDVHGGGYVPLFNDTMTLHVASGGNSKQGVIIVKVRLF